MRWDVPKRRCGWRNQCGRIPSSETRFKTPLEPTMAVLTAPANIKTPTTTTKARNAGPKSVATPDDHQDHHYSGHIHDAQGLFTRLGNPFDVLPPEVDGNEGRKECSRPVHG